MTMSVAELIKRRSRLGLSQRAMAKRLHMSERMLKHYEAGDYDIPRRVALATEALLWRLYACDECQDRIDPEPDDDGV